MSAEDFLPLLTQMVGQAGTGTMRERDGVEVGIEGAFCEQPPLGLMDVIEDGGCLVKDDDLAVGWRLFPDDVRADGDPLTALAQAYLSEILLRDFYDPDHVGSTCDPHGKDANRDEFDDV